MARKRRSRSQKERLIALLSLAGIAGASLPYNPTRAYLSSNNDGAFVYILDPPSSSNPSGQLKVLSTSAKISADSVSPSVVTSSLPFLEQGSPSISYTCTIDSDGSISVYSGSCTDPGAQASLWKFASAPGSAGGTGSWEELSLDTGAIGTGASNGVGFLGSAISFLPDTAHTEAKLYLFGGMCPFENATSDTWTSAASYSNQLTLLSSGSDPKSYGVSVSGSVGQQPIPEAGCSITPLQPTYSNTTDGSQTIQQDFLLIGGHTQNAFINMSQVALFSLPQASWTFLPISQPAGDKTDLVRRQESSNEVEPRSGHTAVLSADGSKIVVFGGWVGDINTPAEPQLAILEVGLGYGGSSEWSWTDPSAENPGVAPSTGIFGHAAVLLPGNVMMVYGGYNIAASGSSRARKRALQDPGSATYLFNITSNSWSNAYDPSVVPNNVLSQAPQSMNGHLTHSQKAGLGAGLTVGLLIAAALAVTAFLYWRRLKNKRIAKEKEVEREVREKELGDLDDVLRSPRNRAPRQLDRSNLRTDGIWDGRSMSGAGAYPWPSNGNDSIPGWKRSYGRDSERSGLDVEIPSPNRGLRKNNPNNPYVAPRYDENRRHRASGSFPVIDEGDEEEATEVAPSGWTRSHQRVDSKAWLLNPNDAENPFRDPSPSPMNQTSGAIPRKPVGSSPLLGTSGPQSSALKRQREMQGWVKDWAAADAALSGRASPEKSDRTRSDLSDQSARSGFSEKSGRTNTSAKSQPPPASSARFALNLIPAALNPFSVTFDPKWTTGGLVGGQPSPPRSAGRSQPDTDSFETARSSPTKLLTESETLVGTHGESSVTSGTLQPDTAPTFTQQDFQPRNRPPPSRTRSKMGTWMLGSVRRAIPTMNLTGNRSSSMTSTTVRPLVDPTGGFVDYSNGPAGAVNWSTTSSPTKGTGQASAPGSESTRNPPRRTVSDGANAEFWTAKKGAADWGYDPAQRREDEHSPSSGKGKARQTKNNRNNPEPQNRGLQSSSSLSTGEEDPDWDPEDAIHERTVQVMFTVPREKLRVVNTDIDASSIDSVSNYDGESKRNTTGTLDDLLARKGVDPMERL